MLKFELKGEVPQQTLQWFLELGEDNLVLRVKDRRMTWNVLTIRRVDGTGYLNKCMNAEGLQTNSEGQLLLKSF